ncbi:hypothetical protein BGZ54_000728 [Gamsiella multidivaricata]|nr:hypothetical protein BGZ54_000728 [Gamsiella multidivaricata]
MDALKSMLGKIYSSAANILRTMLELLEGASKSDDHQVSRSQVMQAAKLMLAYCLEPGPERNESLEHLASRCYDQFHAVNDWQSLEDALKYLGEALEAIEDDVDYARLAVIYSKCLQARYMRGRNKTDLENAIDWAEKSTDLTRKLLKEGATIEALVRALGNLWHCLFTKVHQLDEATDEDFEKMMAAAQEAADVAADSSLTGEILIATKSDLGMGYQLRWEQGDDKREYSDLDRSLQLGWEVVDMTRSLSSESNTSDALVTVLSNLSFRLQTAYLCYVSDGSLPQKVDAVDLLAESTIIPGATLLSAPTNTLAFVLDIKNFLHEFRDSILGRSSICLDRSVYNLEQLCMVASEEDRKNNLSSFYGISRYAAAAHLHLHRSPFAALQILEKGRGIANAILQEESVDKRALADVTPDLARRYIDALQALKNNRFKNAPYHERREPYGIISEARKELFAMPGAFRPPRDLSFEEMISLAEKEDIVVVNITDLRSDAIIIRRRSIHNVHLPNLDEDALSEKSWEIQARLAKESGQEDVFPELHRLLTEFLRDLWKNLVQPVMDFLGYTSSPASRQE